MVDMTATMSSFISSRLHGELALESYTHFHHHGHQCSSWWQERAFYVLQFAKLGSAIAVQRSFHARFKKPTPCRRNIYHWYKSMHSKGKSTGWPHVSQEAVICVCVTFQRSPRKSTRRVSRELHHSLKHSPEMDSDEPLPLAPAAELWVT
jgi:hypothetical protein